jgi:type I restriction enzyme R subunit
VSAEQIARQTIAKLLTATSWAAQDLGHASLRALRGVAIREFPVLRSSSAELYIDGKVARAVEGKKAGVTLTGVKRQPDKYTKGLPISLRAWARLLPFAYHSTAVETRPTNQFGRTDLKVLSDCRNPSFCLHRTTASRFRSSVRNHASYL